MYFKFSKEGERYCMKHQKPLVKNFPDYALIALEKQKQDKKFSKYVHAILLDRYLEETVTINTLAKKFQHAGQFQADLLWDAISLKLINTKIVELKNAAKLIDYMPIDYVVRVSQHALQEPLKQYASVKFYEK